MPWKEYIAWFDMPKSGKLHGQSVLPKQELIRCKNCEWYEIVHLKKDGTDDRRYKPTWCSMWRAVMSEEDFCSMGERKEE